MKTLLTTLFAFTLIANTSAQTNLVHSIRIQTLSDLYTVENIYDSTFARYAIIELDDSVDIKDVEINYANAASNEMVFTQSFLYSALAGTMNTSGSNSLSRSAKTLYFFMGYLPHSNRYRLTVKLKDLNGDYNGEKIKEF